MKTILNAFNNIKDTQKAEQCILELAASIREKRYTYNKQSLTSPADTRQFLIARCAHLEQERFGVIWMDSQHQVLSVETLFNGTVDSAAVYPREVVKSGLKVNAAAGIIFHNHPSGIAEPSNADKMITDRLVKALGVVDIRILDHMVVGGLTVVSFAERGLI